MSSTLKKIGVVVVLAFSFGATAAQAANTTTEVYSFDQGVYNWDGNHEADRNGVFIGEYYVRNFFAFDLTGVDLSNLQSAKFVADSAYGELEPGYTATYTMYDIVTPLNVLLSNNQNRVDIYNDLSEGVVYGSRDVTDMGVSLVNFTVDFGAAGIAALKNTNGLFAFGGALTSNDPNHLSFLYGDAYETKLVLTFNEVTPVPEADTSAMMIGGGLLVGAFARRRNRK